MICPNCGCEQRESDHCVQCLATLPPPSFRSEKAAEAPEKPKSSASKRTSFSVSPMETKSEEKPIETPKAERPIERPEAERPKEPKEPKGPKELKKDPPPEKPAREHIRVVAPERRSPAEEGAHKILITTTQKVEGKKIGAYFGLINANIIIEMEERLQAVPDEKVFSVNASYRSQLKTGLLLALRDLRGEAALLGANAIIATSFNFQRVDPRSLLLSAVGTAVRIEEPK